MIRSIAQSSRLLMFIQACNFKPAQTVTRYAPPIHSYITQSVTCSQPAKVIDTTMQFHSLAERLIRLG